MLRKVIAVFAVIVLCTTLVSGCKKSDDSATTAPEPEKTAAEYEQQARQQITEENMDEELEKLEQELDNELGPA